MKRFFTYFLLTATSLASSFAHSEQPKTTFELIESDGVTIGRSKVEDSQTSAGNSRTSQVSSMRLKINGQDLQIDSKVEAELDQEKDLLFLNMNVEIASIEVKSVSYWTRSGDSLEFTSSKNGQKSTKTFARNTRFSEFTYEYLKKDGLLSADGSHEWSAVSIEGNVAKQRVTVKLLGEGKVQVSSSFNGASRVGIYKDDISLESRTKVLGLSLISRPVDEETYAQVRTGSTDLDNVAAIPAPWLDRNSIEKSKTLKLKIVGLDPEDFDAVAFSRHRQSLDENNVLTITAEELPKSPAKVTDLATRSDLAEFLLPSGFVDSDHESIKKKAKDLVRERDNVLERAQKILKFVPKHIDEKKSFENRVCASEVLRGAKGDCEKHSLLFVALARAAGIPAREVSGLMHDGRHFGWHAWAEIHTGAGWLSVDPTFNQIPADVSHIVIDSKDVNVANEEASKARLIGRMRFSPR
jgi:transglutaminase-like putative cysteine protease